MSANYGRKVALTWNGEQILGVREKGFSMNGEAVNITSDEDNGVQLLLREDAETSHEISLSGVTKDTVFRVAKASGQIVGDVVMTYEDGYTIQGEFNLSSYSETQPYNDAITFETTLQSNGVITHTPGST